MWIIFEVVPSFILPLDKSVLSCDTIRPFFFSNHLTEEKRVATILLDLFFHVYVIYYTIIDFNEVDIKIYQPKKVIFTKAASH